MVKGSIKVVDAKMTCKVWSQHLANAVAAIKNYPQTRSDTETTVSVVGMGYEGDSSWVLVEVTTLRLLSTLPSHADVTSFLEDKARALGPLKDILELYCKTVVLD